MRSFIHYLLNTKPSRFSLTKPENCFFLIALVFGLLMCFLNPPFLVPDEYAHFDRAFSLSRGIFQSSQYETLKTFDYSYTTHWFPLTNGYITEDPNYILSKFSEVLDVNSISTHKSPAGVNIFFVYLPSAVGIWISIIFNLSPIALFFVGRVSALLFWIFLITISIKLIPFMKWPLAILALSPMCVQQAASYSPDSVINGLSFIFLSYVMFLSFSYINCYSSKSLALLSSLALLVVLSKNTNIVLILSIMLLSADGFASTNKRNIYIYTLLSFCMLFWAIYLLYFSSGNIIITPNINISIKRQLLYILINPIDYIQIFIHTMSTYFVFYFESWVGIMAYLNIYLPESLYLVYAILLLYSIYNEPKHIFTISNEKWIGAIVISLLYFIILFTTLYIIYNPVGNSIIEGVQGRYFIPITPLLLIVFIRPLGFNLHLSINPNFHKAVYCFVCILVLATSIYSILLGAFDACGKQQYNINKKCTLPLRTFSGDQTTGELINTTISQSIISKCNNLSSFSILFSTYKRVNTSTITISILDVYANKLIIRAVLNSNSLIDNDWVNISFPKILNSKDRQYNISIQSDNSKIGNAITAWETNTDIFPESVAYINGNYVNKDLAMKYTCNYGLLFELSNLLSNINH
jgi:uncharacterized membrane protein